MNTARRSIQRDIDLLTMTPAIRDDMIARLWATRTMDTLDIAMACGCREATVQRILTRQREARRG